MVVSSTLLRASKFDVAVPTMTMGDMVKGVTTVPEMVLGQTFAFAHASGIAAFREPLEREMIHVSYGFIAPRGFESGVARHKERGIQEIAFLEPPYALHRAKARSLCFRYQAEVRNCSCEGEDGTGHDETRSSQPRCARDGTFDNVVYKSEFCVVTYDERIAVFHKCGTPHAFSVLRSSLFPPENYNNKAVLMHFKRYVHFKTATRLLPDATPEVEEGDDGAGEGPAATSGPSSGRNGACVEKACTKAASDTAVVGKRAGLYDALLDEPASKRKLFKDLTNL